MLGKRHLSRREFLRGTAGLLGASVLSACAGAEQAPAEPEAAAPTFEPTVAATPPPADVTLQVWSIWDLETEMKVNELYDRFSEQNPGIAVRHTFVAGDQFETKFRTAAAGKQLPDIFTTDGINVASYACSNLLADLTPLIPEETRQDYYDAVRDEMVWEGKQWAVPIENHLQGVWYNQDMLDAAGAKYPATWDDLIAVATSTTDAEQGVFGFEFPIGRNEYVMWWASTFLAQNNAAVTNADQTKATINDANAVATIQFLQDLVHKHKVSPQAGQIQAGPEGSFRSQKVAMQCSGSWGIQAMLAEPPAFKFDWGAIPVPRDGRNAQGLGAGWGWTMWNEGAQKEAAGTFMTYMAGDEWGLEVAKRWRIISPRKSISAQIPELTQQPFARILEAITNFGVSARPKTSEYPLVTDAAQSAIDNTITGNMPIKPALDEAAAKIDEALAKATC